MTTITANVPLLGGVFDIAIRGRKIESIRRSRKKRTDLCVGPTLFDVHANGYGGRSCRIRSEAQKDAPAMITRMFREQGIGWWMPTVSTASHETMATAFRLLGQALDEDKDTAESIPGFHMEGPYISDKEAPRGAHPPEHIRAPDWNEFQRFQELSGGRIRCVTLAPEREGALEFIRKCVGAGVIVSIGHSDMDRETLLRAVEAGATMSTHLGNGGPDMIQRHNNFLWYQLACRRTYGSFITDGEHLPQEFLHVLMRAKGLELSVIESDTVEIGGLKPGVYRMRGRKVEMQPSGRIVLYGTSCMDGSSANLRQCAERAIRMLGLTHEEGWRLASVQPAKAMGLERRLGMEPGRDASLTVYRYQNKGPKIDVLETWVAGRKVFDARTSKRTAIPEQPADTE